MLFADGEVNNATVAIGTPLAIIGSIVLAYLKHRTDAFEKRLKNVEQEAASERKKKHNLANFILMLFGELYTAGVEHERLEELRNQYYEIVKD